MKRITLITLIVIATTALPREGYAQFPVFDWTRLGIAVLDYAKQQVPQIVTQRLSKRKAFRHYRRVTQYVGVDVFISGAPRAALTATAPASPKKAYAELYAPAYAAGVPERVQDSLSIARMHAMEIRHATELDSLSWVLVHLEKQILELNAALDKALLRDIASPAPSDTASNQAGEVEQIAATILAKASESKALHALAITQQARFGAEKVLYARQHAARSNLSILEASSTLVGPELAPPRIAAPRYHGVRKFLRFPGLGR